MGDVFWMLEQLLSSIEYPEQQSMRCRRVRPTNAFVKFKKEEIEQSIPDRFERQVDRYPDHIAVKTSSHELSYDALNKAANRVARAILEQTREGEEPIALLLEHGAPVITAILGVLKAAKIYVPLDPSYPRVRIAYMLEDSQAGLIVTDNKNFPLARELTSHALQALNVDEMDSGLSTENLGLFISPDTTAYILYTSGSTGQPKGVVQNHCNVLHQVRTYTNDFHICADDRQSLLISCSFAAAVKIVFSTLLNGAALFPFDLKEEGVANLANWLIQEEITIYFSVPTTFRRFVSTLTGEDKFPKLRLVSLGGEPVCKRHVDMYKKHFSSGCLLGNRLGSTETQSIRWYFMDKKTQINGNMVPVGYAIEDVEVVLLDDAGEDVGFNRVGEITVKSRYLSPGYWRRPDLTRAAFLPDPEGGDERVYRTGDLA
ncbi:MAG: AMP-binding protein, partial [bacterium]